MSGRNCTCGLCGKLWDRRGGLPVPCNHTAQEWAAAGVPDGEWPKWPLTPDEQANLDMLIEAPGGPPPSETTESEPQK